MFSLQEVAEYYSKHAQSPQRWHTPGIIEDLKVQEWKILKETMKNNV